jgi:HD superfamily phosphohydrolase
MNSNITQLPLKQEGLVGQKYKVGEKQGHGGACDVYMVTQLGLNVPRALKMLRPENAVQSLFTRTFQIEIKLLSELTHKNVIKILDAGSFKSRSEGIEAPDFDYYIMEFVGTGSLKEFPLKNQNDAKDLLVIFDQIFDGLVYIHARDILHFDIKPTNIMVWRDESQENFEAKISDLGTAIPLKPGKAVQLSLKETPTDTTHTYAFGTSKYLPEYARKFLNKQVEKEKLLPLKTHIDLYCLGATMAEVISKSDLERDIASEAEDLLENPKDCVLRLAEWPYLKKFIFRLLEKNPKDGFKGADEAREALLRRDPRQTLPARIPEITSIGSVHSIAHNGRLSHFTDRAYKIITHPCFQRLQHLNQLGFVDFIYPDGRHSRLSHSLEAFEMAREVACQLLDDADFRLHIRSEDVNLFLCAALLHDIGHYPLTHVIEDLKGVKEDWQVADDFLELKLDSWGKNLNELVKDQWDLDTSQIVRLIGKIPTHKLTATEQIFRSLLNGALDVDKMAYLTQDSRFTGVSYGSGIAVDLLISSLTVLKNPKGLLEIGITDKGISAAESLITARYHMYSRVYWHHANRAVMAMVKYVMRRLFRGFSGSYSFSDYLTETLHLSEMEALRLMSEKFQKSPKADHLGNPLKGIIDGSRTLYKRFASFSYDRNDSKRRDIHQKLISESTAGLEELRKNCLNKLKEVTGGKLKDSYVLFDVPRINKEGDALPDCYVKDQFTGQPVLLKNQSEICKAVYTDFAQRVKKSRIFVHPSVREALSGAKFNEALSEIENVILG